MGDLTFSYIVLLAGWWPFGGVYVDGGQDCGMTPRPTSPAALRAWH